MTTHIGVLSDIHGDLYGFQRAMTIFAQAKVSQILCAGDIADRGAKADQIVQLLQHSDAVCIKGNHEHTVLHFQARWRASPRSERLAQVGRIISDTSFAYLQALPNSTRVEVEGVRILMGHGTPWSDLPRVFPTGRQALFDQIHKRYSPDTDLIILGHTHKPMRVRMGDMWILNPGSVYGVTARDSHTCAILSLPERNFQVFDLYSGAQLELPVIQR